jgi:hypothetical protein
MRTTKSLILIFLLLAVSETAVAGDLLDNALATVGKTKSDLGYRPKGYWNRYPYDIPYKLPAFDDLLAEPLKVYDYANSMKESAMQLMVDSNFWNLTNSSLYLMSYALCWERRVGGFRNYSANLIDTVASPTPLAEAIARLYATTGHEMEVRTFGQKSEGYISKADLDSLSKIDPQVQQILAVWIVNLIEAHKYRQSAFRNVPDEIVEALYRINDIDATQGDGQVYYPQFDDCARLIDWQSLVYASFKATAATDIAAKKLKPLRDRGQNLSFRLPTPLGTILLTDAGSDVVPEGDYLLICDFGGNDKYTAGGGSKPSLSVSVLVDLAGDDTYGDSLSSRQFGSGICGIGVCIDVDGNDHYNSERLSQGVGIFGTGILCDFAGTDDYRLTVSGQGCGYFGVGMLVDREGNDTYYITGDGQGAGGIGGGIGVLVDYQGNDHYTAEPFATIANRGDYHSQGKINANNAQGWGGGRRGDGSDGHSWAGGLGALIDCFGDDDYYSGNWTLGVGYWFGIGFVYDVNGNDTYKSCYFTQASGAHYCIGAMFDESGNDTHELFETAGAGLSFGWDFAVTLLVDWGGNDSYTGKIISIANAQIRSNSFLFDFGGDDLYQLNSGTDGMGDATFRDDYRTPRPTVAFTWYAESYGVLIDVRGNDRYLDYVDSSRTTQPRPGCGNSATWYRPARDSKNFGFNNYGIGVDVDSGRVEEMFILKKER